VAKLKFVKIRGKKTKTLPYPSTLRRFDFAHRRLCSVQALLRTGMAGLNNINFSVVSAVNEKSWLNIYLAKARRGDKFTRLRRRPWALPVDEC